MKAFNKLVSTLTLGVLVPASILLSGCVSTVTAYTPDSDMAPETEGETRLWALSEQFDEALIKSDSLYHDPELEAYLNSILIKLFPEYQGSMRVKILKAPVLNAMALTNGSIYINAGLLAVIQNEAQLATILAHEGEHFVQKHGPKQREYMIQAAGWSMVGGVLLAGAGIPADLATLGAISSISGYSRDAEAEADNLGYERLRKAGYDVEEAPEVFRYMIREIKAEEIKRPYFFSTHPKLESRVANFEALNKKTDETDGDVIGEKAYLENFSALRSTALKAKLERGQYKALIALLTSEDVKTSYGDIGNYILGEAYRLRGSEGDIKLARESFTAAEKSGLNTPEIYKSIGLIEYKTGNTSEALSAFSNYLKVADEADPERSFISMYMEKLKREQHEQTN